MPFTEDQQPESEKERFEKQKKTLMKLMNSGLNFLLFGGWAGKVDGVYEEDYYPRDIDIYIDNKQLEDWKKFFETSNFQTQEMENKIIFTDLETGASVDTHLIEDSKEDDTYIEKTSREIFHLPKEAFEVKQFENQPIIIMGNELACIFEGRRASETGDKEKLEKLEGKIDRTKLMEIRKKFKYEEK